MSKRSRFHGLFLFLLSLMAVFPACTSKSPQVAQPAPSTVTTTTEIPVTVKRYENALFALDKNHLRKGLAVMSKDFSFFLGHEWQDTMNMLRVYNFINDPNIKELYSLEQKKYGDITELKTGLTHALNKFLQAYPERKMPTVYTYISGLDVDNPVYFSDTAMAIGLDVFLGSEVLAYPKAGIPKYKTLRFTPDHLLPQCMLAVSDHLVRVDDKQNTLLDQMVMAGKALYFLDITLPDVKDEFKIGYSTAQLQWSHKNDGNIWAFIIEHQLLFSSDPRGTAKLMTDAPFTAGFANESPGRLGAFIGWQIVRAYMDRAKGVTLKQLMEDTDAQKILKVSAYKPENHKN